MGLSCPPRYFHNKNKEGEVVVSTYSSQKISRKGISYAHFGYIFALPFTLAFLIFSLYPIIYTVVIGFTDLKGLGNTHFNFLEDPFLNFKNILASEIFLTALKNTFLIWIVNFLPQILLALLLTAWFTDTRTNIKGQGFFKVMFYMPNIITAASIAVLFNAFFAQPVGPMNSILEMIHNARGIEEKFVPTNFFVDKTTTRGIVAFIQFWMWYGNTMIMLISGVLGINPAIFEAAEIDGSSRWQTFFQITIPCIKTILLYVLVTSMIGGLNMYDIPKLLQNGGPDNSTLTTSMYIQAQAFAGSYMYNRAAAASMIMFVIIMILTACLFFILRDGDEVAAKKLKKQARKEQRLAEKGM